MNNLRANLSEKVFFLFSSKICGRAGKNAFTCPHMYWKKKFVKKSQISSDFERRICTEFGKKLSKWLSKQHSTYHEEHFGSWKKREQDHSQMVNYGEQKVYILRERFPFRNIYSEEYYIEPLKHKPYVTLEDFQPLSW